MIKIKEEEREESLSIDAKIKRVSFKITLRKRKSRL